MIHLKYDKENEPRGPSSPTFAVDLPQKLEVKKANH